MSTPSPNVRNAATGAGEPMLAAERRDASAEQLLEEVRSLSDADGGGRDDPALAGRLLQLRHLAGIRLIERGRGSPEFASPASDALPADDGLIEITPAELTPELLRAAILDRGCLLARGLVEREVAIGLAEDVERAFAARTRLAAGGDDDEAYYVEFEPEAPHQVAQREWVEMGGGVFAVDSPRVLSGMFRALEAIDFPRVVRDYLGEPAMISAQKTTLRKAAPDVRGAWHQDGKFLGEIRALNLWLSLSRCGDQSPGLDIVPRRLEDLVDAGTDSPFPIEISQELVEEAAGDAGILRPIFEPGDALLFDELFLHQTGSDPKMPKSRYAVESWFFGPSAFPSDYTPVAA